MKLQDKLGSVINPLKVFAVRRQDELRLRICTEYTSWTFAYEKEEFLEHDLFWFETWVSRLTCASCASTE